jgi:hypothetical protein
MKYNNMIILD